MALRRVAELVNRATVDSGVLHALKNDPAQLQNLLQLSSTHIAALRSADRVANKPLVQAPAASQLAAAAMPKVTAADTLVLATAGTLLPPYGSGNFQTAAGGFVPVGTPTATPPPTPPAPSPQPPSLGVPPPLAQPPGPPPSPPATYQPPPPLPPQQLQLQPQSACCCAAAITATCSMVAQTSLAAIAAITAIAQIDSG
jgi:hypothetical protein